MICLVYVSAAKQLFDPAGLNALLTDCQRKNTAAGITGLLMYADGNILQTLEGEPEAVGALFARISRDSRHHQVLELYRRTIDQRQFGRWSMAVARPESLGSVEGVESIVLLRRSLANPDDSAVTTEVRMLLTLFADNMR